MFLSDGREIRALRSILMHYVNHFNLSPKVTKSNGRNLVISPFELSLFLDAPLASQLGIKYKSLKEELSSFTDYSFTFGDGFCSSRSMWSQVYKDRIRTRNCDTGLLLEPERKDTQLLFREIKILL